MNKYKHMIGNGWQEYDFQIVTGDLTCCGKKTTGKSYPSKCYKVSHKNYINKGLMQIKTQPLDK